jgi:hypothetical protein
VDHRISLERSLLDAGLHPIGMEHFVAQPNEPADACLREVGDADLFVGIYGWNYGFVPHETGVSITEMEFLEAQRLGKPCFCFFIDPGFPWPMEFRNQGEAAIRLAKFKRRIEAILVRSTFTTPDDLATRVLASIQRYERLQTRRVKNVVISTPEQRCLNTLLERGKQFWVAGVLSNVAGRIGAYSLKMTPVLNAVDQPWHNKASLDESTCSPAIEHGFDVFDIFVHSGRLLLILGDPGSGKTVTLLQLAQHLIEQAQSIASEPVPVVFHLGSWAVERISFEKWLILEARSKYYVSGELLEKWLRENRIILLLDGLDEMERAHQSECVLGINDYIGTWGVPGIAICARRAEYLSLPTRFKLNAAINVEALSKDQIQAILVSTEQPTQDLQELIDQSPELAELATSPLMLNLMRETSSHTQDFGSISNDQTKTSLADIVLARYVEGRFVSPDFDAIHRQDVINRLGWIAKQMKLRGESIFQTDALQPDCLGGIMRFWYWLISRVTVCFVLGATEGAYLSLLTLFRVPLPGLDVPFATTFSKGVWVGLLFGVGAGFADSAWFGHLRSRGNQQHGPRAPWPYVVINVVLLYSLFASVNWFMWHFWWRAPFGLIWALLIGLRIRNSGLGQDIRMPEIRGWSWRSAGKGFVSGEVIGGIIFGFGSAIIEGVTLSTFLFAGTLYGVAGAIFMGWRANTIALRIQPNQGIRLFARSMLKGGLLLGATTVAFITFYVIVDQSFSSGLDAGFAKVALAGLILGIVVGGYAAVCGALWYGGIDVINHYVLRVLLWISGRTPLRLIHFLDGAVEIRLLRRIGAGYEFIHRSLLEYFATIQPNSKQTVTTHPSKL